MVLSHHGTLWLDTVEERVHLVGVGVHMSVRSWRRDMLQRGLAEDNKEVCVCVCVCVCGVSDCACVYVCTYI